MRHLSLAAGAVSALLFALPAGAENLACQTVNGQTVCARGPGTLECRTVNGRTDCTHTPAGPSAAPPSPCETRQGRTVCRVLPGMSEDVIVERKDGRVRVRTGGVDVDVAE
ncbi:MAG TPA: hypothetical protein VD978_04360 [Azospirillum sp.]|nr:hypothetical protein [Azospirillum sp.]